VDEACAKLIADVPGNACATAWQDFGEVAVVADREEMAALSDLYASEHTGVHAADLPWWLDRLKNYGSLFLGEETTVRSSPLASGAAWHAQPHPCRARAS